MDPTTAIARHLLSLSITHPLRVGIDGVDAAGKTTLADNLVPQLAASGRQVLRASIDGFHHPREVRYRQGSDSPDGYYADSFDLPALRRLLLDPLGPLPDEDPASNRIGYTQIFDYRSNLAQSAAALSIASDAILLFDGVFLQRPDLAGAFDCLLFVQVSFETVLARALQRDSDAMGGPQATRLRYQVRYIPAQQRYLDECHPAQHADIIIHNDDPDHATVTIQV
jgi:uridine kinase